MKTLLHLSTAIALSIGGLSLPAYAESNNAQTQMESTGAVDAGKLIGASVVDGNGDTVGEIDSVMVDANGKVKGVVLDVSNWLQSEKLVSVPWTDLTVTDDDIISTRLTKEEADAATAYQYADQTRRGKVLTENGDVYAGTTGAVDENGMATSSGGSGTTLLGTPIKNQDGSINASQLVGLNIQDAQGDTIGEVGEVVIDSGGKLNGVLVDVGGFLGMGTHHVLLNWNDIQLSGQGDDVKAVINTTKENLKALPEYSTKAEN